MSYSQYLDEHRRRDLLRIIAASDGSMNAHVALLAVRDLGYPRATSITIADDFELFRRAGVAIITWPAPSLAVATLTERGHDVAAGRETVDGIASADRVG